MSAKASRRPNRERQKSEYRARRNALLEKQRKEGLVAAQRPSAPNAKSEFKTVEEEQEARELAVLEQIVVMRTLLPILLVKLRNVKDPRNPRKVKHQLAAMLLYGILAFVFQMSSRREANRTMTQPQFMGNLKLLFPELEDLPHHDTLARALTKIDVEQVQDVLVDLVRALLRRKKLRQFLMNGHLRIAIDGTRKLTREICVNEHYLQRTRTSGDDVQTEYYVYVMEACVVLGAVALPLMSEFLSFAEGDVEAAKQDCELKAFKRLAKRLKDAFPRQRIMLLLDGLYANGPVLTICRQSAWAFVIVLKDGCLPSVWQEANGLKGLLPGNRRTMSWGNRRQRFWWVNDIEYYYDKGPRRPETVHVVVCDETWEEVDPTTCEIVTRESRHAWICSQPLCADNLHQLCNLCGRHRWAIENSILVEKRYGYQYEHCFAHDWNATKGYHYLMRIGHFFNLLAQLSEKLGRMVRAMTARGFISFVRSTLVGPWLRPARITDRLAGCLQLRLE